MSSSWVEWYNPISKELYYYNADTKEFRDEKPVECNIFGKHPMEDSVVSIQCMVRKSSARRVVHKLKRNSEIDRDTIRELGRKIAERLDELEMSNGEKKKFAMVAGRVARCVKEWILVEECIRTIDDRHDLCDVLDAGEVLWSKINDASRLAIPLDKYCIESAWYEYQRVLGKKQDLECKLKKERKEVLGGFIGNAGNALRKVLGEKGFVDGKMVVHGLEYDSWHPMVKDAITTVTLLMQFVDETMCAFAANESKELEAGNRNDMHAEERRQRRVTITIAKYQKKLLEKQKFLAMCRKSWNVGLCLREDEHKKNLLLRRKSHIQRGDMIKKREILGKWTEDWLNRTELTLWQAAKEGHSIKRMQRLIDIEESKIRRVPFDLCQVRSPNGQNLLQIACWWGHEELVQFFIAKGLDASCVDSFISKSTLLHQAATKGAMDIIPHLLDAGIPLNVVNAYGDTPIHCAVRNNHIDVVLLLLDVDDKEVLGMTPKWQTLAFSNYKNRTPLQLAIHKNLPRMIQILKQFQERLPLRQSQQNTIDAQLEYQVRQKKALRRKSTFHKRNSSIMTKLSHEISTPDTDLLGTANVQTIRQSHLKSKFLLSKTIKLLRKESTQDRTQRFAQQWKTKAINNL